MTKQANQKNWWKGACIYQVYPRSFMDTTGSGVGDLKGITAKLDYIASLGVDGIWVSPFFTSPMKDFGYDVSDYWNVDPMFGTLEDFKELVEESHKHGLKVIIDQVYSHTSDQHKWFQESRQDATNEKADWYVWEEPKPDGTPPSNWQSPFGGPAWTWDNRRKQYYLHNFLSSQPDLNFHNEEVQNALFDVARFWLNLGVDGFRLDAIHCGMHNRDLTDQPPRENVPLVNKRPFMLQQHLHSMSQPGMPALMQRFREVMDEFGDIFTVAEVGGENASDVMKTYISDNNKLSTAYSFDFLSMPSLTKECFMEVMARWQGEGDDKWPSWAFSNHDAPRVLSRWGITEEGQVPSLEQAKLFQLLLFSLRGNVFLYQGEELGLKQSELAFEELQDPEGINNWPDSMGRDGARTPIPWHAGHDYMGFSAAKPWLPVNKHAQDDAVSVQAEQADSALNFAKQVIAIRKASDALLLGELEFVDSESEVIAFVREFDGEKVLCLFNLSTQEKAFSSEFIATAETIVTNREINDLTVLPGHFAGYFRVK